jgi:predicted DNA-binding helix-hairpin-helix protein
MLILYRENSFWHKKIDPKVVWSRFHPVRTQSQSLHRKIEIRIFMSWTNFKLISHTFKILEMPILSRRNYFWHKKIDPKVVWSRFHPVGSQSRSLHRKIEIRIFMSWTDFNLISHALKILEMPILSRRNSFWHKKIDPNVVWSRFHAVGTQSRSLHRKIVIRIFLTWTDFKHISHALKILEMPILSRRNSFWPKKIDPKVVWSRFHPVGTQSRSLHRKIVIRIFMTWTDFKHISHALKILEMPILSRKNFFWH